MVKSSTPTPPAVIYRFAGFEVHEASLELRDSTGARVEITPLAFDLLVYLIRHRDRVVPNDELFERMWGGVAVTPSSLSQGIWAVRNAVGDTGSTKRVIQNVRSRGYRMIADVEVVVPAQLAPARPTKQVARDVARARDLIGREAERAQLRAALGDVLGGRGRICLLTGWPGMGKTCLAQELCRNARAQGARVVEARCFEDEAMPPFWPWQQMARALMQQHSQGELSAWAGDGAGDLIKIIPELGERLPGLPHAPQREPGHHRFQLFDALAGLLQKSAEQSPLVLVLEDLHWADESTLRFLEFLAPSIERMQVMLVVTLRAHAGDGALESVVGNVLRQPGSSLLELSGLDAAQIEALLRMHDVASPQPQLVGRVVELTFGNPFFVTRLAQWLVAKPDRALDGPIELPREARAIVRELIAALPPASRDLLAVASVLGQSFHVTDLRRVSGGNAQEVLEWLEPALAGRILHEDPEDVGVYSFAHSTMRETLYADLPRARRARLHGLAAAGIAQAHADDPTPRLSEIARHYYEAAAAGAAREAVRYCRLAAERAYEATGFEESVAYYKRALAALELLEPLDERVRCELLLGLGRALRGTPVALDEVQAVFASAAEIAQRIGDVRLLCEAAMRHAGRSAMRMEVMREHGTVNPAEIELLERALDRLGSEETADRALVEAWLAHSLYHSERSEERRRCAQHAVDVARRVGDPLVLAECSMLLQASVCGPAELDARIETLSEVIELTRRHNAPGLQLDAQVERAFSHWERADRPRAEADMQCVERLAEELRQPREKRRAAAWRATLLDAEGRFDEADRAFRDIDLAYPLPPGRVAQGRAIRALYLQWLRGRGHEAIPALEAYAAKYPLPVAWHSGLPGMYASAGRTDAAQRELDRLAIDGFAAIPDDHNFIGSISQLAWAACALRDVERCGPLYRKLAPYADRVCLIGLHGFCTGVVHRSLGELSIALGELPRAEAHLTQAIELNTRIGATVWAALSRLSYAELLLLRNARSDRERAFEQLAAAGLFARTRSIQLLVDRAERLREQAAGSAAPGRRA